MPGRTYYDMMHRLRSSVDTFVCKPQSLSGKSVHAVPEREQLNDDQRSPSQSTVFGIGQLLGDAGVPGLSKVRRAKK